MYARQLVTIVRQDAVREAGEIFRRDVVPLLQRQRGFAGVTMLVDPDSGSAQFVTCWRTLSDLAALNENRFFDAQVAKLASFFTIKPQVKIVDVCIFEEYDGNAGTDVPVEHAAEGGR
jgi:heme-degrading monooxygenase HmoA